MSPIGTKRTIRTAPALVRYWVHSGHWSVGALNGGDRPHPSTCRILRTRGAIAAVAPLIEPPLAQDPIGRIAEAFEGEEIDTGLIVPVLTEYEEHLLNGAKEASAQSGQSRHCNILSAIGRADKGPHYAAAATRRSIELT
jgi:hypothetical protein